MLRMKIAVLPGDGIGAEIVPEAVKVLRAVRPGLRFEWADVGGSAFLKHGHPLPEQTMALARCADAVLFGAVGDPRLDHVAVDLRPEQGILGLRSALQLFANLRPARCLPGLSGASTLKARVVERMDVLVVRELTGDIYFGKPRGRRRVEGGTFAGSEEAYDSMHYCRPEVERVARIAFDLARQRRRKVTSVDKANVLESSRLWREVVIDVHRGFPDVELEHMYVDNAAMQLVRAPADLDVVLTGNLFGDILSDEAGMVTGSIGLLPSASLAASGKGLYEPSHGSAPDIAGKGIANLLATILSAALLLRHSAGLPAEADRIEQAVRAVLREGLRTPDIWQPGMRKVGTQAMGDAVVAALHDTPLEVA